MKENFDIRWIQRFNNFTKALLQLEAAVHLAEERPLSNLEEQGLIQAFEFTHELAWKTLKDIFNDRGNQKLYGSKDVTREAFQYSLIKNGDIWMDMIKSRNNTSHTYNEETADEIVKAILNVYYKEFYILREVLQELKTNESK